MSNTNQDKPSTLNPGDKVADESQTVEEKADQVAVEYTDVTLEENVVPTYFVAEDEEGNKEALHHIKDAEEISDVIRQARTDEDGNRKW